jgi:hypothetical protein
VHATLPAARAGSLTGTSGTPTAGASLGRLLPWPSCVPRTTLRDEHFTGGAGLRDVVVGMSDRLTVSIALAAGLSLPSVAAEAGLSATETGEILGRSGGTVLDLSRLVAHGQRGGDLVDSARQVLDVRSSGRERPSPPVGCRGRYLGCAGAELPPV